MKAICCSVLLSAALVGIAVITRPFAQSDVPNSILASHRSAVVQLRVQGKKENVPVLSYGTGFLISTSQGPRIITAGHVVQPEDWDFLEEKNLIYYRVAAFGSSLILDPVTDAIVGLPDLDMAQVYLGPFQASTVQIALASPRQGDQLTVLSWRGWGGRVRTSATAQRAQVVSVDKDHLVLSGSYLVSDSGSPVLNGDGQVVGMLVELSPLPGSGTQGLALSVSGLSSFLSEAKASPVDKTPVSALADLRFGYAYGYSRRRGSATQRRNFVSVTGCVLLGKRSANADARSGDLPFGLPVIDSIRNNQKSSLVGRRLAVRSPVDLRSKCPTVMDDVAYYGSVTARLDPGDTVIPQRILSLNYADDVYYWADGGVLPTSRRSPKR